MKRITLARRLIMAVVACACAGAAASACAKKATPLPDPDASASPAPDMTGRTVMVLPAQQPPRTPAIRAGATEPVSGLDDEIAFFLAEVAPGVRWIGKDAIRRAVENAPNISIRTDALAVGAFHVARLQRIGDPLWGDLRTLGMLLDARYALIPFAAGYAVPATGPGRVEIGAALIDTTNGNVLWIGYAAGDRGDEGSRAVVASAAKALAEKVVR